MNELKAKLSKYITNIIVEDPINPFIIRNELDSLLYKKKHTIEFINFLNNAKNSDDLFEYLQEKYKEYKESIKIPVPLINDIPETPTYPLEVFVNNYEYYTKDDKYEVYFTINSKDLPEEEMKDPDPYEENDYTTIYKEWIETGTNKLCSNLILNESCFVRLVAVEKKDTREVSEVVEYEFN